MLRKWEAFEGIDERGLGRYYTDYECTCDKCGKQLSLEDKVQVDGENTYCLECADDIVTVEKLLGY